MNHRSHFLATNFSAFNLFRSNACYVLAEVNAKLCLKSEINRNIKSIFPEWESIESTSATRLRDVSPPRVQCIKYIFFYLKRYNIYVCTYIKIFLIKCKNPDIPTHKQLVNNNVFAYKYSQMDLHFQLSAIRLEIE